MQTVHDLLDAAKAATQSSTDKELAARLGVKATAVSNYRRGVSLPDAVVCEKIADITRTPLARVLGIVGEARAISRDEKAVWKRLASAAALFLLVAAAPLPGHARDSAGGAGSGPSSCNSRVLPIMSRRHRLARFLRAIWPSAWMRPDAPLLAL